MTIFDRDLNRAVVRDADIKAAEVQLAPPEIANAKVSLVMK